MDSLGGKRLVIFGCGYVGAALARAAAAAGARVTALTRNAEKAAALRAEGVAETVVAELSSAAWHGRIPAGAELVVNCVSAGGGGLKEYRRSYVEGMKSIRAWAAADPQSVGTMVYTSSTSVYPQGGGSIVDEDADTSAAAARGQILNEAEALVRPSTAWRRVFVLRLAGIYGPGRHQLLDQLRRGATEINGGSHRLNLAHRDDIVAAILACLTAPDGVPGGIFNVADGAPAPREEVIRWLAARLGRAAPLITAAAGGRRRDGAKAPDRIISSARLQGQLGWRPRFPDFRAGYEAILGGK
jgi:nucleoside-diphosphate-sugar epimerase